MPRMLARLRVMPPFAIVVMLLALAIACGSGDDEAPNQTTSVGTLSASPARATGEPENHDTGDTPGSRDREILFVGSAGAYDHVDDIWVIDANGSAPRRVTPRSFGAIGSPEWSPDRTRIAFYSQYLQESGQLWIVNADGTGLAKLQDDVFTQPPFAWSPDSNSIAFTAKTTEGYRLEVIDVNPIPDPHQSGETHYLVRPLTGMLEFKEHTYPDWSPDGKKIVASSGPGNGHIEVLDASGSGRTRLTDVKYRSDNQSCWSPDGTKIAFIARDQSAELEVFSVRVMNADGSDEHSLFEADPSIPLSQLSWSPAGDQLVFEAHDAYADIYTVRLDGSHTELLTADELGDQENPSWSSDGSYLSYENVLYLLDGPNEGLHIDLWTMHPDGSGKVQVTDTPELESYPSWYPN